MMNRREMFGKLVAAAGGMQLGTALEAEAKKPRPPAKEGDKGYFLEQWEAVRPPLTPAEAATERALIAAIYLLDALEEVEHLHDLADPGADCGCDRCFDAIGWQYLLNGPWTIWGSDHCRTANARHWEEALEERQAARKKEYAAYLAQIRGKKEGAA